MNRPTALLVQPEGIPNVLKAERRWVCWRYVWKQRDSRWSKIPHTPTGRFAESDNSSTWTTFDSALVAYEECHFDGIGFCLGHGWAGIDIDGITSGPLIDRLPCYREVSPSGTGVKAIGRSHRIGGEIKSKATTWSGARYFAITGQGQGDPTVDITELLDEWFAPAPSTGTSLPSYIQRGDTRGSEHIESFTDDEVVARALASPQADKFIRLVRGDLSDYGGDHSRADQALVCILAYWCQGDMEQVDRMFRQSGLMRDKWKSASYRRATLSKAVLR